MTTEPIPVDEKLDEIGKKLDAIEKKLSEKWFLPVFMAVLTALLGLATFLIQRSFSKADVSENKQNEIIGQFVADSKVEFYKNCKVRLNNVSDQFESLCEFGPSKAVEDELDSSLIGFRKFVLQQQVIDQSILESLKKYSEFISESAFDIGAEKLNKEKRSQYLQEGRKLFTETSSMLDDSIKKLVNP